MISVTNPRCSAGFEGNGFVTEMRSNRWILLGFDAGTYSYQGLLFAFPQISV